MSTPMIKLESSDGQIFEVEVKAAQLSILIKDMLDMEDLGFDDTQVISIPQNAPNINGAILQKIIQWANHHKDDPDLADDDEEFIPTDDISSWDSNFLQVNQTLFEVIRAANFLNIRSLLDVACKKVAKTMAPMTLQQVREVFHIHYDFTEAEEEQIIKENSWCEEVDFGTNNGSSVTGVVEGEISVNSIQNLDADSGEVLNNCVVVRKLCLNFSFTKLLEFSQMNKVWNYETRSVLKKRKNVLASLVCSLGRACPQDLESFGADLRRMNVVPYSGIAIVIDWNYHGGGSTAMSSTLETILARLPLKNLSVRLLGDWEKYKSCPTFLLVKKLLQDFSGNIEHLTLDIQLRRLDFVEQIINDCMFPSLKILKLLDLSSTSDASYNNYMKQLVLRAPSLKELHTYGQTDLTTNVLEGSSSVLVYKSALSYPSKQISLTVMSALRLEIMELVGAQPGFNLERFNRFAPLLLQVSCTTTLRELRVHEVLAVPLMCYGVCLENVKKLEVCMRPYCFQPLELQIFNIVKNIDFTRMFPELNKVRVLPELNGILDLARELVIQQADAVLMEPQPDRAAKIHELHIEHFIFCYETAPFFAKMFPDIEKLELSAANEIPFGSIWKLWPNLKEIQIQHRDYQIPNLDSVFCGIFPEEVAILRQMSNRYLKKVNIVPVMPAITCLKNLRRLKIKLGGRCDCDEPFIDAGNEAFIFSKVTRFLAFKKLRSITVFLEFGTYHGIIPETSHLEPFASISYREL